MEYRFFFRHSEVCLKTCWMDGSFYKSYLWVHPGPHINFTDAKYPGLHGANAGRAGRATCKIAIIGSITVVPNGPGRHSGFSVIPCVSSR